jgi:hypothetical protein
VKDEEREDGFVGEHDRFDCEQKALGKGCFLEEEVNRKVERQQELKKERREVEERRKRGGREEQDGKCRKGHVFKCKNTTKKEQMVLSWTSACFSANEGILIDFASRRMLKQIRFLCRQKSETQVSARMPR